MSAQWAAHLRQAGRAGIAAAVTVLVPAALLAGAAGQAAAAQRQRPDTGTGTISTVAGGTGGPARATNVSLGTPWNTYYSHLCAAASAGDSLYIGDGTTVRQVNERTGSLTTPAGVGNRPGGFSANGVRATDAVIGGGCGITVDHAGNLLLGDSYGSRCNGPGIEFDEGSLRACQLIRVVAAKTGWAYGQQMTAGRIYTVAGDRSSWGGGTGVPATRASLSDPTGVTVDHHGNLVIADTGYFTDEDTNARGAEVRVVAETSGTFYGIKMTAGYLYHLSGGSIPFGPRHPTVRSHPASGHATAAGIPASRADLGVAIGNAVVDAAGNIVLADSDFSSIEVIAASTGTFYGQAMTAGDIYDVAGVSSYQSCGYSGDGGPATSAATCAPRGVEVDGAGNLIITDSGNNRVRVVAGKNGTFYGQPMTAGDIYTVAGNGMAGYSGNGGPATSAELRNPQSAVLDAAGNLVISDWGNGMVRVVAARSGRFYGLSMTAGDIYTVAGNRAESSSGNGGPASRAELSAPGGVATDPAGNVLIADTGNHVVRVTAARTGSFYGRAMTAGDIYTVAGDGTRGSSGDGRPAVRAKLSSPTAVTADGEGNLLITDSRTNTVRTVAAHTRTLYGQAMTAGDIYPVAGKGKGGCQSLGNGGPAASGGLCHPLGLAIWTQRLRGIAGLMIADAGHNMVRMVAEKTGSFYGQAMTAGDIYTVAGDGTRGSSGDGGPATSAELNDPTGVAVDPAGNLVIADTFNEVVRVVAASTGTYYGQQMTAGDIYTVAGDGTWGFSGDGGPATSAELNGPGALAVDSAGNLVIADLYNNRVRVLAAKNGLFYGQQMTAGDIYTVAGGHTNLGRALGDGGQATSAQIASPAGVAVDHSGDLLIADTGDQQIRMVTGGSG